MNTNTESWLISLTFRCHKIISIAMQNFDTMLALNLENVIKWGLLYKRESLDDRVHIALMYVRETENYRSEMIILGTLH